MKYYFFDTYSRGYVTSRVAPPPTGTYFCASPVPTQDLKKALAISAQNRKEAHKALRLRFRGKVLAKRLGTCTAHAWYEAQMYRVLEGTQWHFTQTRTVVTIHDIAQPFTVRFRGTPEHAVLFCASLREAEDRGMVDQATFQQLGAKVSSQAVQSIAEGKLRQLSVSLVDDWKAEQVQLRVDKVNAEKAARRAAGIQNR